MQITESWIKSLLGNDKKIKLAGTCHDCKCDMDVLVEATSDGFVVSAPVWKYDDIPEPFFKCLECFAQEPNLKNYQPTEVYSRVVGYLRPVKQWNPGKQAEKALRKDYALPKNG